MDDLCQCGCGQPAPIARDTDPARGHVRGRPHRFIVGHHRRLKVGEEYEVRPGPLDTPCWIWRGKPEAQGYGIIVRNGVTEKAHRYIYKRETGRSLHGERLDHLCRVRLCVNPQHLEPVTHRENVLRGEGPTALNARKTHCKHGHEFTPENIVQHPDGGRRCLECARRISREAQRRRRARAKEAEEH